jgi:hypothetical protein
MTVTACPHGHPTPTSADRTPQGFCRRCKRDSDARAYRLTRDRVALAPALEQMTPDELIEALKTSVDSPTDVECAK